MELKVFCHAGYRGEETPRRLRLEQREIDVREVLATWREPGHRLFTVLGHDGERYTLRRDDHADTWELVSIGGCAPEPKDS